MNPLYYLAGRSMEASPLLFAGAPEEEVTVLLEACAALEDDERARLEQSVPALRFALLAQGYLDGPGQQAAALALGLALACALNPAVEKALRRAAGAPLNLPLAWQLAYGESPWARPDDVAETYRRLRWLMPAEETAGLDAELRMDGRLLAYLAGGDTLVPQLRQLAGWGEKEPVPSLIRPEVQPRLAAHLRAMEITGDVLHLTGPAGIGKWFELCGAAVSLPLPLLGVDCRLLADGSEEAVQHAVDAVRREALFYAGAVCLRRADAFAGRDRPEAAGAWEQRFWRLCVQPLLDAQVPVCVCTDSPAAFTPYVARAVRVVELPGCTRAQQIALWQGFAEQSGVVLDSVQCGSKYKLTPGQISAAVRQLSLLGTAPGQGDIARACAQVLPPPEGGVRPIRTGARLEDLKLPEEQKQKLRNIAGHVLYRHKVYDSWNMESRFSYGRNVSALFVGPPGTGKTMAVHVLADMLQLPLYRIDLSQVVDKYIGETEKRLEAIFDAAERSNVILFFDEADSIFGKRSEVNDAKDKYANTEVSYILQRIEQYEGIVILATNYKRNIDEAFMRRMRYLVEFQMPSRALREEIWRASFAPQVPLQDGDYAYLARQFELSGGSIKNIALNAVFLAAAGSGPVTMGHILASVRDENLKMGKPMLPQDFAEYAGLMQG